jgi:NDP-sugar pyrophosphorylase family protein
MGEGEGGGEDEAVRQDHWHKSRLEMNNGIQVVILSAGTGYRLTPYSIGRPKVLCPVCNSPLLVRLLVQLNAAGIRGAVLALPPMPIEIQDAAKAMAPAGFHLRLFFPDRKTNNKVAIVRSLMKSSTSSVLVIYGDSLLSVDFRALIRFHNRAKKLGGVATILYHRPFDTRVPEKDNRTHHGIMSVSTRGIVTRFIEKPKVSQIGPGFDLANAAVFICERSFLEQPEFRKAQDFSFDIFQPAILRQMPVHGFDIGAGFRFDVGSISRLYEANIKSIRRELEPPLLSREVNGRIWIGQNSTCKLTQLNPPVLLGNNVTIHNSARIGPDVVIGDGTVINQGVTMCRSLLMKACLVKRDVSLDYCILGDNCIINDALTLPRFTVIGPDSVLGGGDWPNIAARKEYAYV